MRSYIQGYLWNFINMSLLTPPLHQGAFLGENFGLSRKPSAYLSLPLPCFQGIKIHLPLSLNREILTKGSFYFASKSRVIIDLVNGWGFLWFKIHSSKAGNRSTGKGHLRSTWQFKIWERESTRFLLHTRVCLKQNKTENVFLLLSEFIYSENSKKNNRAKESLLN